MKRYMAMLATVVLALSLAAEVSGQPQKEGNTRTRGQEDPVVFGEPLSHWIEVIRKRNTADLGKAFEAIVELGPAASAAVPELTRIVEEPFTPICAGKDDRRELISKLASIYIKGEAIDSLGAIGPAAASSARSVIEWSLTIRVQPSGDRSGETLFIELVSMDVLERMRGAGTVGQFGVGAAPAVKELLDSGDVDRRKFAVAILNEASLPIVSDLMKSESCKDRILGLSILGDMWPVVASRHLLALKDILACSENDPKGFAVKEPRPQATDNSPASEMPGKPVL